MDYRNVQFDVQAGIARLTFNRPERMNSVSGEMNREIRDVLARLKDDREARVLVVSGSGRAFCAGQDLTEREQVARGEPVDLGDYLENNYNPLILALTNLPIPVIAAVNGVAAGAGASIALACDIVIAARSANFIQAFSKIGLLPDCGGTWMLPRLAGTARALGMTLLGEKISAEQAEQWGLIWRCVDDLAFADAVNAVATQLAAAPTRAIVLTRQAIRESWDHSFAEQLCQERDFQRQLGHSRDYAEGVTAFLEKRQPKFIGH